MAELNMDYIREKITEDIGQEDYILHIEWICDILEDLGTRDFPEAKGVDDLAVKFVVDKLRGRRQTTGKRDIMDRIDNHNILDSLDAHEVEDNDTLGTQDVKGINDFTTIGPAKRKQHIVNVSDRVQRLVEILNMLKEDNKLKLTDIHVGVGNETANDWVSDLKRKTIDGKTEFITDLIGQIYDISKNNFKKGTTTDLIRRSVTKQQLKTLDSKEICKLCDLEYNGKHRKMISRLNRGEA